MDNYKKRNGLIRDRIARFNLFKPEVIHFVFCHLNCQRFYEWFIDKQNNVLHLMQEFKLCIRKIGQSEITDALPSVLYVVDTTEHISCEINRLAEINVAKIVKVQFRIESVMEDRFAVFHFYSVISDFHSFGISHREGDATG